MAAPIAFTEPGRSAARRALGGVLTAALHALACVVLLSYEPSRAALLAIAPVMVSLISPPAPQALPEPPKPTPVVIRPRRRPVAKPPPDPKPPLVAPTEAPSAIAAPPPIVAPPPEPAPVVAAPPSPPAPIVVTPPVFNADYLDNPAPAYPPASRRNGEQGRVILRVLVNDAGAADEVEIRTSSGHARLDEAARDTVKRWRFVPARLGEQPVPAWVLIPISFRLQG